MQKFGLDALGHRIFVDGLRDRSAREHKHNWSYESYATYLSSETSHQLPALVFAISAVLPSMLSSSRQRRIDLVSHRAYFRSRAVPEQQRGGRPRYLER